MSVEADTESGRHGDTGKGSTHKFETDRPLEPIAPSPRLQGILEDLPWAIAVDTEKARSEVIPRTNSELFGVDN
ncbi:hypothetical protein IQ249_07970 [Lusitaniella coriacea LEGE 07157]|uniref:Uncharacterized protein n=1 Tax=Lusitaniella coriacea LEGE 07157 TaxID=945747 RepID=A0A8J7DXR1_9CYAN|nr:hypothetical protein [Lusitaniella coriacea]MBE9115826.1 hypothetical protein [Lusitaniella coriacea LEGE 07157]